MAAKRGRAAKSAESAIEGFAEDLGRLLGSARAKADNWLQQRQAIAKNLEQIRETATTLLNQLGHQAQAIARRGRPKKNDGQATPAPGGRRRRRKLSAKARKAISDAQKARWARQRGGQTK